MKIVTVVLQSGDTANGAWAIAGGNKKTAPPTVRRETDRVASRRPNSIEDTVSEPFKHRMFGELKNVHN